MELNIRKLTEDDWGTLTKWWDAWPEWDTPPRDFLPNNGTGGLMVESEGEPIVAGFMYITNSKGVLLEWIISDPKYKEKDRYEAINLLLIGVENLCKDLGYKYIFSIGRNKSLITTHKNLGWHVDDKPSYEIIKTI